MNFRVWSFFSLIFVFDSRAQQQQLFLPSVSSRFPNSTSFSCDDEEKFSFSFYSASFLDESSLWVLSRRGLKWWIWFPSWSTFNEERKSPDGLYINFHHRRPSVRANNNAHISHKIWCECEVKKCQISLLKSRVQIKTRRRNVFRLIKSLSVCLFRESN